MIGWSGVAAIGCGCCFLAFLIVGVLYLLLKAMSLKKAGGQTRSRKPSKVGGTDRIVEAEFKELEKERKDRKRSERTR